MSFANCSSLNITLCVEGKKKSKHGFVYVLIHQAPDVEPAPTPPEVLDVVEVQRSVQFFHTKVGTSISLLRRCHFEAGKRQT